MATRKDALRAHCMEVVLCENAQAVLTKPLPHLSSDQLKCATVARSQLLAASKNEELDRKLRWQVPEPWNGNLGTAPILFIGQNPSADQDEDYPAAWHVRGDGVDEKLFQFFQGRFGDGPGEPPIKDGTMVRQRLGGHATKPNKFLAHVGRLAGACLGRQAKAGIDYAITEAVRCKAARPPGMHQATEVCARKHLTKTLQLSQASVLICLGGEARVALEAVTQTQGLCDRPKHLPVNLPFPLDRWHVLCLEHSGARGADNNQSIKMAVGLKRYLDSKAVQIA